MIVIWIFVNLGAFIKKPMPTNVFVLPFENSLHWLDSLDALAAILLRRDFTISQLPKNEHPISPWI